jgi:hypothetical protein
MLTLESDVMVYERMDETGWEPGIFYEKTVHNDSHADSSSGTNHPESAYGRGVRASAFSEGTHDYCKP